MQADWDPREWGGQMRFLVLFVSEAQAGPRATAPGGTEVTAASGVPARPYQDGHDLTFTDSRDA